MSPAQPSNTIQFQSFPSAAEAVVMVIFGASGDLAHRKVIPAVFNLFRRGCWSDRSVIVGYARSEISDEDFRDSVAEFVREQLGDDFDQAKWDNFASRLYYCRGGYDNTDDFRNLEKICDDHAQKYAIARRYMFYLATPPGQFSPIIDCLGQSSLAMTGNYDGRSWSRIVIEKPFGNSLESARQLNAQLAGVFDEKQIYRIDHYLGKETVQNLLALRFANGMFEPLWKREHIDNVQITVAETLGVEGRGGYYDKSGAIRDMLQNHMMNLLALVAMEAPAQLNSESIRNEKVKVLQSVRKFSTNDCSEHLIRAQYTAGHIGTEKTAGYLEHDGVPKDSTTETFAAARIYIDNWRWAGVPFYLRTGKRLARRVSEISIEFTAPPAVLYNNLPGANHGNILLIRVQPQESLAIKFQIKQPFSQSGVVPYWLKFPYSEAMGSAALPDAYERLILDAAAGDSTLFIRSDEIEAAWTIVQPMLEGCDKGCASEMHNYPCGSWGPAESDQLLAADERVWHEPSI